MTPKKHWAINKIMQRYGLLCTADYSSRNFKIYSVDVKFYHYMSNIRTRPLYVLSFESAEFMSNKEVEDLAVECALRSMGS